MKSPLICALSAAVAASGMTVQAAESFSPILGYYTSDVPAGLSTMVIGLVKKKDHQGGMDVQGAFAVADGKTTIVEDDRDMTTVPLDNHYMEVMAGPWEGLILDIEAGSATTNSFRVLGDLSAFPGLTTDVAFSIREHATLGDLFPDGGGFAQSLDFLIVFDSTGNPSLYNWSGTGWATLAGADANGVVVYPGQGILIQAGGAREVLVGKNGVSHVKENRTMVPYYSSGVNLLAPPNPVVGKDHLLGDMGFATSITPSLDFVVSFSTDGALSADGIFSTDGTSMNTVAGAPADDTPIPVGDALFLQASSDGYYVAPAIDPALLANP